MSRNILFIQDDFVFSYRVGGIIRANKKILLKKPRDEKYHSIIGGSVSCMETTEKALIRIFSQEINAKVAVERLFATGEIFFPWEDKPCHQLCLYYELRLLEADGIPKEGSFTVEGGSGNEGDEYVWVTAEDLNRGVKVYPKEIQPYLKKPSKEIVHIISKQI